MVKRKYKNIRIDAETHRALKERQKASDELKTFDDAIRAALEESTGTKPRGIATEVGICVDPAVVE